MAENENDKVKVEGGAHVARKAEAKVESTDEPHDYVKDLNKQIIGDARAALIEEAKHLEHTDGPSNTRTGSTATTSADLLGQTQDPYARAIPPGPDDPYADEDA